MEAPEKIWINPSMDLPKLNGVLDKDSVEYTRIDAFIEKACKFLDKEIPITDLSPSNMLDITFKIFDKKNKKVFIKNFKAYMKGE